MSGVRRSLIAIALLAVTWCGLGVPRAGAAPEGQMTLAQTISIAPRWFDPVEAEGIITPFIFYYALHARS